MKFEYKKMYIDGQLSNSSDNGMHKVICPATEEVIGVIAWANKLDALRALVSAKAGFKRWSKLDIYERSRWMLKLREAVQYNEKALREAVMYETGKTWGQTQEDYDTVVNALEFYPDAMRMFGDEEIVDTENTHSHTMVHQPAGVVVALLAWNFPLLNLGFKLAPALAAGCSIIIKPSPFTPLSAYILGEILNEIDFPKGVVNILVGDDVEVATTLTNSTIPAVVTMIGSTATGRKVISNSNTASIKRVSMELGGNAPFIVFDDANIETAAEHLKILKYGNCGQVCISPNRVFVHKSVYDLFLQTFLEKVKNLKIGFGQNSDANMGPLINKRAVEYAESLVADAGEKGGRVLLGGRKPDYLNVGYYFEPTVIVNMNPEMELFKKEIFGPITGIMTFESDDIVLELANRTDAGLASYIYTIDENRIKRFAAELEFGEVQVNGFKYAIYLPHGGIKQSGMGFDCSYLALHDYLVKKRVTITQ